jgi:hypothetical protein
MHLQEKKIRMDPNSLFRNISILRPKEIGKFTSNPGYRQMHDVIHHDMIEAMLDCWRMEAELRNSRCSSLKSFSEVGPSWKTIVNMSETIVEKYIASTPTLADMRTKANSERDKIFENQTLRNRNGFLYLDMRHAMKTGDIGHVEALSLPWIYIFKATGKHKYASHFARFLKQLFKVFPKDLW